MPHFSYQLIITEAQALLRSGEQVTLHALLQVCSLATSLSAVAILVVLTAAAADVMSQHVLVHHAAVQYCLHCQLWEEVLNAPSVHVQVCHAALLNNVGTVTASLQGRLHCQHQYEGPAASMKD